MKMVYTHENRLFVANAKNILEAENIKVVVKNEHAASAIGEVSAFDAWVQLWVIKDSEYRKACSIIEHALSENNATPWTCKACGEENDPSFDLCWSCHYDPFGLKT